MPRPHLILEKVVADTDRNKEVVRLRLISLSQVTLVCCWIQPLNPAPWLGNTLSSSYFSVDSRMRRVALSFCSSGAGQIGSFAPNAAGAACVKTVPNLLMPSKPNHLGQRDKPCLTSGSVFIQSLLSLYVLIRASLDQCEPILAHIS